MGVPSGERGGAQIEDLKDRSERLELGVKAETAEEIREGLAESWRVVVERGLKRYWTGAQHRKEPRPLLSRTPALLSLVCLT